MGKIQQGDQIELRDIEFRWKDRIAKGMITVVAGKPDQGKGLFGAHLVAEISKTENVLVSFAEDDPRAITAPRLIAAGADMRRVTFYRFVLPTNFESLAEIIVRKRIGLVIMDPFNAHLSGVSRHSDKVREILNPLTDLIEKTNTSVVIIDHVNKRPPASGSLLDVIGGSGSGLTAAARAAFVFGKDPDNSDNRVLVPAKFNIGPEARTLSFEIDTEEVPGLQRPVPLLQYDDEIDFDGMRLFEKPGKDGSPTIGRPADKRAQACEWLTTYLAKAAGPVKSGQVADDAKQAGMSLKTLRRAADDMAIVKMPPGGGRNCTWDLPDEIKDVMGVPAQADDVQADGEAPSAPVDGLEGMTLTDADLDALLGGSDDESEV